MSIWAGFLWLLRTLPPDGEAWDQLLETGGPGDSQHRSPDLCVKPYTPGGAAQRTAGELLGWTQFTLLTHGIVSKEKNVCVPGAEVWSDFPRRS